MLIDTKLTSSGLDFRAETIRTTGRLPVMVINTHHHADHVGGNFVFSGDCEIVAQANVRSRLPKTIDDKIAPALRKLVSQLRSDGRETEADAIHRRLLTLEVEDFAADREVQDELDIRVGGVRLQLMYMGTGHTDNDLAVYLPDENVLHTGDLLFCRLHPFIDRAAGANTRGWQSSLIALSTKLNEETIVVPGHGQVTNLDGLIHQHYYFMRMRDLVAEQLAQGRTRDQIITRRADEFKAFGFHDFRGQALGVLHDELVEERG